MPEDVSSLVHQTLLGDALEHAEVAAAVFADDGRYLACNRAFCRLTGYERDEIVQMRVAVDLAPDGGPNQEIYRGIVDRGSRVTEGPLRRKDGSVTTVNVWAIPARAAGLPYFVVLYWEGSAGPDPRLIGP